MLELKLKNIVGVDNLSLDILKTLNLYDKDEYYNIAGELLTDKNNIDFSGIDIVRFGTGVMRIIDEYRQSVSKPKFEITENNIRIILPVIEIDESNLSEDEVVIYNILMDEVELSRGEVDGKSGFSKSKILRIINSLVDKSIVKKIGEGPGTTYTLK